MGLDGLLAEDERSRDLGVGLAVDDEPGDVEFARGQRVHSFAVGVAREGPAAEALPQLPQFMLGLFQIATGRARSELSGSLLQRSNGELGLTGRRPRSSRECPRTRGVHAGAGRVGGGGGCDGAIGGGRGVTRREGDGCGRPLGHGRRGAEANPLGDGCGTSGRASRLDGPAEREPAARQ